MKSVMISIHPKWCELIANGKKTIEVRKTRPNCNLPFKCFIYETKDSGGSGKVIGEFICDKYDLFGDMDSVGVGYFINGHFHYVDTFEAAGFILSKSQLSRRDLILYRKGHKNIYGWHISNLKIYDKPKELSDFIHPVSWGYEELKRPPQSWCYAELWVYPHL